LKDEKLKKVHDAINRGEKSVGRYFLDKNLLFKSSNNEYRPDCIVVPRSLVPYVLAAYHFMSHAGSDKMLNLIQLKFTWANMAADVQEFSKGCSLCSIYKSANWGAQEIGIPRVVLEPAK
jgi:hypothetical protein